MRMNRIVFICLVFIALSACKKVDELTKFYIDYDQTFVIPAATGINIPLDFVSPDKETNSETEFEVNDTRKDLIEEILLEEVKLTVLSPEEEDFSFLESISIYLKAEGLDEIRVAWNDNVSADASSPLALITSNADLKEYIKKDAFVLRCKTVTDEVLGSDYSINIYSNFFVDAKLIAD